MGGQKGLLVDFMRSANGPWHVTATSVSQLSWTTCRCVRYGRSAKPFAGELVTFKSASRTKVCRCIYKTVTCAFPRS